MNLPQLEGESLMLCPRDKRTSKQRTFLTLQIKYLWIKEGGGAGGPQTVLSGRAAGHAASLSVLQPPPRAMLSFPECKLNPGDRSCFEFLQEGWFSSPLLPLLPSYQPSTGGDRQGEREYLYAEVPRSQSFMYLAHRPPPPRINRRNHL